MLPGRMAVERIAGLIEAHVLRQPDRQILGRDRHGAAGLAMDDRDRAAPIALARNAPVAQLVIDLPLGLRLALKRDLLEPARDLLLGLIDRQAVEEARIDHHARRRHRPRAPICEARGIEVGRAHDRGHAEPIGADEIEVALVVRGAAENRARSVFHQHEIGDIDRQPPLGVERMNDPQAGVVALLLRGLDRGDRGADPRASVDERGKRRVMAAAAAASG